jgi:hypothetical protein
MPTGAASLVSGMPHSSGQLHATHLLFTVGLFALNLFLTQLITNRHFVGRLRYVGHEMVFLSLGIVTARLFLNPDLLVFGATFLLYLVVWAFTLVLTKQVIDKEDRLYPQVIFSLISGLFSVYFSAAGFVEHSIARLLMGYL